MYKVLGIILMSFLTLLSANSYETESLSEDVGPTAGEVLRYNVYLKTGIFYFSLGEAVFSTTKNEEFFELKVEASTYRRWKRIHEFDSEFTSTLDSQSRYPQCFVRNSVEKGNTVFDSISFDQERATAEEFVSNNDGEIFNYNLQLSDKVYDMVSLFHGVRYLAYPEMDNGDTEKMKLLHNRREYDIRINYEGMEEKKVKKGGKYQSYRIAINAIKGLHFEGNQIMTMWIAEDDQRFPVAFETPLKLGSLRIALKD